MFLAGLTKEKQEAFLNLAHTMVYADGRLDENEKKIFDSYKAELVDVDFSKAHDVDFSKELAIFDNSSQKEKFAVFFELYAIALIDESFPEEEKKLVDIMQKRFNVSDAKMQEMKDGLRAITAVYNNLTKIIEA
ncbi:MAG: hypothetical protein J6O04_08455 [Selenomonadaceae bacterium]|nr:hypothetical protein [Selenomonadaceae bacterium]